jgi:peptide deformylase
LVASPDKSGRSNLAGVRGITNQPRIFKVILIASNGIIGMGQKSGSVFRGRMAILQIRTLPDPVLRQKAKKVTRIDKSIQKLIDNMIDTVRAEPNRAGLAAPQVGVLLRIAVIEVPEHELITLVNPEIVKKEGERIVQEGCLSVPGYYGEIKRAVTVKIKAQDRYGKTFRLKGQGLLAQAFEQEIEHLDGILYIDHLESPEKLFEIEATQEV